jgi:metallo-beta-lactamase family protein
MSSYSAHGDYNEMMKYLSCQKKEEVKKVFLVHGEYKTQVAWREKLLAFGFGNIEIPEKGTTFEV